MEVLDLDNLDAKDDAAFNAIATGLRAQFVGLVETIGRPHEREIDWIVDSLSARNIYQSPLFVRCCRLAFVNDRLTRTGAVEIRVSDRALADTLRRRLERERHDVTVVCTESFGARVWRALRPIRQWSVAAATFAMRYAARVSPPTVLAQPVLLLDTFVLSDSIVDGVFRDRYYAGLLENVPPQEREKVHFLPSIFGFRNPRHAFRLLRSARTPFLIHDDYLRASDYWFALARPFRLGRFRATDVQFEGYEVGPMLREEQRANCADVSVLLGLLYYRFAERFSEAGVRVAVLVDWHENQPLDRGLIAGFHRFHPATKIVGYQGYILPKELFMHTCPTAADVRSGAAPDVLAVPGPALFAAAREFTPDIPVMAAPGFRFQKVWRDYGSASHGGVRTLLAALPIETSDAAFIIRILTEALAYRDDLAISVRVKPHPTTAESQLRSWLPGRALPPRWDIVGGDFHDQLGRADMLIGSASSTCIEALARGIPVIVVAPPRGIVPTIVPVGVAPDMWAICRDRPELEAAMDRLRYDSEERAAEFRRRGEEIRQAYFTPVTAVTVRQFLQGASEQGSQ